MTRFVPFFVLLCGAACAGAQTLPFAQLPGPAQRTVRDQADGAAIGEVSQSEDDGEVRYTVTLTKDGRDHDITVAASGKLRSADIALDDVPPTARATLKKTVGQGAIESLATTFSDDDFDYDVTMTTTNGVKRAFTVEVDGKISAMQIDLAEAPMAVRSTVKAQAAKLRATVGDITRSTDTNGVSYDVTLQANGQDRDLSVTSNGKVDSLQVFPPELPAAGQQTLNDKLAGAKLSQIDMDFDDDGTFLYHIQARQDGKPFEFYLTPRGEFRANDDSD